MIKKSFLGEFAKYTSFNILGMLGISLYILADTFFVSNALGTNGLACIKSCYSSLQFYSWRWPHAWHGECNKVYNI